ncbi:hypothetical protein BDN67DRAFT_455048 [Paxillus ammoniavirescens]|nr:hypothetical protein BDN67DRAFT_455048 [Paxillus ammoniavirescens]
MSKSEREEVITGLAARLFSAMLDDLVMDAALRGHHEIIRSRAVCHICHTRCGIAHGSGSQATSQSPDTGNGETSGGKNISNNGTNTPTNIKDGNILFECTVCKRQIASNRYAPHLSSCMGLGTGVRRGAARGTNLKTKIPIESGRSASPYLGSENGNVSDENSNGKGKGKSKSKLTDEAEFNLKRKRPVSPQTSPVKKQKKQKTTGSPVSRLKAGLDGSGNQTLQVPSSQSKVPSKLRSSSTASFLDRERSSTPGSQSSAGTPIATSTSSAISAQSPAGTGPPKRGRPKGSRTGMGRGAAALVAQVKRPSPPRPPPPPVRIEPDYLIDVEGEETGSSTDTDGS